MKPWSFTIILQHIKLGSQPKEKVCNIEYHSIHMVLYFIRLLLNVYQYLMVTFLPRLRKIIGNWLLSVQINDIWYTVISLYLKSIWYVSFDNYFHHLAKIVKLVVKLLSLGKGKNDGIR
jgi:hypothetical protein